MLNHGTSHTNKSLFLHVVDCVHCVTPALVSLVVLKAFIVNELLTANKTVTIAQEYNMTSHILEHILHSQRI